MVEIAIKNEPMEMADGGYHSIYSFTISGDRVDIVLQTKNYKIHSLTCQTVKKIKSIMKKHINYNIDLKAELKGYYKYTEIDVISFYKLTYYILILREK